MSIATGKIVRAVLGSLIFLAFSSVSAAEIPTRINQSFMSYSLSYTNPTDKALQAKLESIDAILRTQYGMFTNDTAVGLLDLLNFRLAMIHPDREEYAASVPKIGILLAYFQLHPEAATNLDSATRHELGLMIKISNNQMAAKFSRQLGLKQIQQVLNNYQFYDSKPGG